MYCSSALWRGPHFSANSNHNCADLLHVVYNYYGTVCSLCICLDHCHALIIVVKCDIDPVLCTHGMYVQVCRNR